MSTPYIDHNLALLAHLRGILIALGESEQVPDESHTAFLERFDELLKAMPDIPEERHLGQDLICQVFHRYPQVAHLVPRDLLWFFGGDCLHYMPDEEIAIYQNLDEQRHEAELNGQAFDWNQQRQLLLMPEDGNKH